MIEAASIETAYSFFHQKLRVYEHSTIDWQRDDIEYAIADYVNQMNQQLYIILSEGRDNFLHDHTRFEEDMRHAVEMMEKMIF